VKEEGPLIPGHMYPLKAPKFAQVPTYNRFLVTGTRSKRAQHAIHSTQIDASSGGR
jgi:hypothetical protein